MSTNSSDPGEQVLPRAEMLARLRGLEQDELWYGEAADHMGCAGQAIDGGVYAYVLSKDTLRGPLEVKVVVMTPQEAEEAEKAIGERKGHDEESDEDTDGESRNLDDEELDDDLRRAISMVEQDCLPGYDFVNTSMNGWDDLGDPRWESVEEAVDSYATKLFEDWDKLTDEELQSWCRVLDWIAKGIHSPDDVPADQQEGLPSS